MNIYVLGICGTFMSGIAQLAIQKGFKVSGCDENIYPPISNVLKELEIKVDQGFETKNYSENIDLFIVGNVVSRGNPLMEKILNNKNEYLSGPEFLYQYILKDRHVISVSGTHGKTTTSAMISKILMDAKVDAGYLIAGKVNGFDTSAKLGNNDFFVVESDEYDTSFFDKRSKFVHYRPSTLLINNLEFDHADIFDNLDSIKKQFHNLIRSMPSNAKVIFPEDDENIESLINQGLYSKKETFNYQFSPKGWSVKPNESCDDNFEIYFDGKLRGKISWHLFGEHNLRNALAAFVTASSLGIDDEIITKALSSFKGVSRRMELKGQNDSVSVYDDFAHHPTSIKYSLEGLRKKVGDQKIICLLEMRSNTMSAGHHDEVIPRSLECADKVFLFSKNEKQIKKIALKSEKFSICSGTEELLKILPKELESDTHIICLSNGSFGQIYQKILESF